MMVLVLGGCFQFSENTLSQDPIQIQNTLPGGCRIKIFLYVCVMGATPSGFQDFQDSQNLFQDSQNLVFQRLGG